jgi:hypothetical protein
MAVRFRSRTGTETDPSTLDHNLEYDQEVTAEEAAAIALMELNETARRIEMLLEQLLHENG